MRGRCPVRVKELVFTLQGLSGAQAVESLYRLDLSTAMPAAPSLPVEWRNERLIAERLK